MLINWIKTKYEKMKFSYHESYWDNTDRKLKLIKFIDFIHNLDLTLLDKMGYWDDKFRPFSYFDDGKLISSVCLYSMDMMVRGKRTKIAQISGVGTLPEYRRQGLSGDLNRKAIEWARESHDFFFLFADDEAFPLYKNCGFRTTQEYKSQIEVSGQPPTPNAVKLNPSNKEHLDMIYTYVLRRSPVSNQLGVFNDKLFMFWCLYYLKDFIYHIPALDCLVLYKREKDLISIYDIVGKTTPKFEELYPYISDENDNSVEFLFMPDRLDINNYMSIPVEDNGTHILGNFPFESEPFLFPFTAHA